MGHENDKRLTLSCSGGDISSSDETPTSRIDVLSPAYIMCLKKDRSLYLCWWKGAVMPISDTPPASGNQLCSTISTQG